MIKKTRHDLEQSIHNNMANGFVSVLTAEAYKSNNRMKGAPIC